MKVRRIPRTDIVLWIALIGIILTILLLTTPLHDLVVAGLKK